MASVGTIGIDIALAGASVSQSTATVALAIAVAGHAGSQGSIGLDIALVGVGSAQITSAGTIALDIAVSSTDGTIYPWKQNVGNIIYPNVPNISPVVIDYSMIFYQGVDMLLAMSPAPVPTSQITMSYVNTDGVTVSYSDRRMYYTTIANQSYLVDRIQPNTIGLGTWTVTASYTGPGGLVKQIGHFRVLP